MMDPLDLPCQLYQPQPSFEHWSASTRVPRHLATVRRYLGRDITDFAGSDQSASSQLLPTMSNKITGKNLHYDQSLPPFLARLKGQHAADTDSPDPILASRRRQAKPRSASQDAEDAPLIVDDDGNVLANVEVAADGTVTTNQEAGAGEGGDEGSTETSGDKDPKGVEAAGGKVAMIGGSKKRKLGKVVGASAEDDKQEKQDKQDKDSTGLQKQDGPAKGDDKTKGPVKAKKKAKKIKLSFGDDDGV